MSINKNVTPTEKRRHCKTTHNKNYLPLYYNQGFCFDV